MEVNTKYKYNDLLKDNAYSIKEFIMKLILKITLSLFLVTLLNCSYLFAYEVKMTMLSDEHFDPLPDYIGCWSGCTIENYIASGIDNDDVQVATITLEFARGEIGQDYGAVDELAKKEAGKLGADFSFVVSGTIYKETGEIASVTYRCVRSKSAARRDERIQIENAKKELKSSTFYKKYQEVWEEVGAFSDKEEKSLGIKYEEDDKTSRNYFDIKTGKQISWEEVKRRVLSDLADKIVSFFKDNFKLYVSEYNMLLQIKQKYPLGTVR